MVERTLPNLIHRPLVSGVLPSEWIDCRLRADKGEVAGSVSLKSLIPMRVDLLTSFQNPVLVVSPFSFF